MNADDIAALVAAIRDVLTFLALVAILVTAPTWGEWLDSIGAEEREARDVAERHQRIYEQLRAAE